MLGDYFMLNDYECNNMIKDEICAWVNYARYLVNILSPGLIAERLPCLVHA